MARKFLGIVERINPRGMTFFISQDERDPENSTMVSNRGTKLSMPMEMEEFLQCWFNWQMRGMLIQDAFPNLHSSYREFLMTAITPEEWKEIFNTPE
jgi:hypothetical protein